MTIPFILKKHKEEVQKTSDDIKILSDEQIKRVSGAGRRTCITTTTYGENGRVIDVYQDSDETGTSLGGIVEMRF